MQINTNAIKQLNAFTQFAADFGFKSKSVAQLDETAKNDGAIHTIKASTTDMKFVLADNRDLMTALNSHADEIRDGVSASVTKQEVVFLSMNTGIYLSISEMAEAMEA